MASKVGAAGRQQRIAYEVNNNTYNIRLYRCSMYNWRAGYSRCNLDYMFQFSHNKYSQQPVIATPWVEWLTIVMLLELVIVMLLELVIVKLLELVIVTSGAGKLVISPTGMEDLVIWSAGMEELVIKTPGVKELVIVTPGVEELFILALRAEELIIWSTGMEEPVIKPPGDILIWPSGAEEWTSGR